MNSDERRDVSHAVNPEEQPFYRLGPEIVMDAVESIGYHCDGRQFPLNSYENRVYQIGIEDRQPLIGKFYRPARWSDEQILEEHQFCFELEAHELPVVAPIRDDRGRSLFEYKDYRFALYPRRGGMVRSWIISIISICSVSCWGVSTPWGRCAPLCIGQP